MYLIIFIHMYMDFYMDIFMYMGIHKRLHIDIYIYYAYVYKICSVPLARALQLRTDVKKSFFSSY
jgi:hypothetical protein